jgi:hypothetical protein
MKKDTIYFSPRRWPKPNLLSIMLLLAAVLLVSSVALIGQPCASSYTFSGTQSGTQTFRASGSITSTTQIYSGSNITYTSATSVRLFPGF